MFILGCVGQLVLTGTAVATFLAVRSMWRFRYRPPLTPFRLGALLTVVGVGLAAPVLTVDDPQVVMGIIGAVMVGSLAWLGVYGLHPQA